MNGLAEGWWILIIVPSEGPLSIGLAQIRYLWLPFEIFQARFNNTRRSNFKISWEEKFNEPYDPEHLILLPPGLPLPEIGVVMGDDINYDLRILFKRVMTVWNSDCLDLETLKEDLRGSWLFSSGLMIIVYETSRAPDKPRLIGSITQLSEFRVEFSPVIPVLIGVLRQTYHLIPAI